MLNSVFFFIIQRMIVMFPTRVLEKRRFSMSKTSVAANLELLRFSRSENVPAEEIFNQKRPTNK